MAKIRRHNKRISKKKIKKEIANVIEFCQLANECIKKIQYAYRKKQYEEYKKYAKYNKKTGLWKYRKLKKLKKAKFTSYKPKNA